VHAQRLEAQRQERHHQGEAGEADERGDHQRRLIAAPIVHDRT
jgi:hypothetical protein